MNTKNIIILITVLLIVTAASLFFFVFFDKKDKKYTTVKVERKDVVQTVSATGTVEALKKLDLNFTTSEKIKEINVKVGDYVEKGYILAKLDTSQLEFQLNKANAAVKASKANLTKLLEGATKEDIKVLETAVENAEISLENAKSDLKNAKETSAKEITKAESSVSDAEISLENAKQNLSNVESSGKNSLNQKYDSALDVIDSSIVVIENSLDTDQATLDYKDAKDTLSILNTQYLNDALQSGSKAKDSYTALKKYIENVRLNPTKENTDSAISKTKSSLDDTKKALDDTYNVLYATIVSYKLSKTELDSLKADILTAKTNINTAVSNLTAAEQNISTQKTVNKTNIDNAKASVKSAESALEISRKSLEAVKTSMNEKINAAENAVKSAEGSLKRAKDQLAFKKAAPRSSDIAVYKAKILEAQANVNLIQSQIDSSILYAPQSGTITKIKNEIGEIPSLTGAFISMIAPGNFKIEANISEVDIAKVKVGDAVKITFDALGQDRKFDGSVSEIDPAQTEISGVIYYKVTTMFTENDNIIKPGMTANLDIATAKKKNVIAIPFQALKSKDDQKYVTILEKDNNTRDVFVEIGLRGDMNVEIKKGIFEGQRVVTFVEE